MGIKQLYNDNLRKLPNEYGDVSVMLFRIVCCFLFVFLLLFCFLFCFVFVFCFVFLLFFSDDFSLIVQVWV